MNECETDCAKVFRTYNPILSNNKPLFSFNTLRPEIEINSISTSYTVPHWQLDPTERQNEYLVDKLFEDQLAFKQRQISLVHKQYEGDILVAQIDCTVIDGASEAESSGFVDGYDMPPIDTWFYLISTPDTRLLFAWIPKEFRHMADGAIAVNCVDCLSWFHEGHPREYDDLRANI
jgi:hypothetical protein